MSRRSSKFSGTNRIYHMGRKEVKTAEIRLRSRLAIAITLCTLTLICIFAISSHGKATTVSASDSFETGYRSILIKEGDSIWSIADTYKGTNSLEYCMNEIVAINNLDDDSYLTAGEYLIVPYYIQK